MFAWGLTCLIFIVERGFFLEELFIVDNIFMRLTCRPSKHSCVPPFLQMKEIVQHAPRLI